eukprot:1914378-Rhodomonas_salina.1
MVRARQRGIPPLASQQRFAFSLKIGLSSKLHRTLPIVALAFDVGWGAGMTGGGRRCVCDGGGLGRALPRCTNRTPTWKPNANQLDLKTKCKRVHELHTASILRVPRKL